MKPVKNPLRRWFDQEPRPMAQAEFCRRTGISQAFLTTLLLERPPWPTRARLRRIVKATKGAVTADEWLALDDPPLRVRKH
jgi:transcriptional regulator with XRE-family HTH domain